MNLGTDLTIADVAILFPLDSKYGNADYLIGANDTGARGVMLPPSLAPSLPGFCLPPDPDAGFTIHCQPAPSSLRVVAMRLDPCFAALPPAPDGSGCLNQLRLVVQTISDDGTTASDGAAHVFYALTRDELTSALKSLVALRLAQAPGKDLGGLAPHVVMQQQGPAGPMASSVRAIIKKYAGAQNLTRVTQFGLMGSGFTWSFAGNDVSSGDPTPMVIPTTSGSTGQTLDVSVGGAPSTSSTDNPFPLYGVTSLTAPGAPAAIDALFRVENPTIHTPNTIDCVSCHLTGGIRGKLASNSLSLPADPYAYTPVHVPAADLSPPPAQGSMAVNFHAFSYNGASPGINPRTINEAAAIVDYVIANVK